MATDWFGKFIDKLAGILKESPYLQFLFISTILLIVSIISGSYFDKILIFFIYSISGVIWRYIEKDLIGDTFTKNIKEVSKFKRWVISIYHVGNVILFLFLLYYLKFI